MLRRSGDRPRPRMGPCREGAVRDRACLPRCTPRRQDRWPDSVVEAIRISIPRSSGVQNTEICNARDSRFLGNQRHPFPLRRGGSGVCSTSLDPRDGRLPGSSFVPPRLGHLLGGGRRSSPRPAAIRAWGTHQPHPARRISSDLRSALRGPVAAPPSKHSRPLPQAAHMAQVPLFDISRSSPWRRRPDTEPGGRFIVLEAAPRSRGTVPAGSSRSTPWGMRTGG